jgi:O-antigen/teichoic acid export membrane protein
MALPLTVAGFALGPAAIRTIWGRNYSEAGPLFLIMLGTFPVLPLFYIARGALVGIGRQKVLIAASAFAAVVDLGLAAALVPPFDAVGAALANAGAQLASGIPVILAARREFGELDWDAGAMLRTAVASGGAGLAAFGVVYGLDGIAGLLLGLAAGVAVFALLAATVKILPADDARWLDGALGRFAGGRLGRFALLCARRP